MTFAADSPLVARVVPSPASEIGRRPGGAADIQAIVIHMAEGGGTVSWLTRPDGNSSHYVIERSTGRLVQMVPESWWAGSLNPRDLRLTNDAPFSFLGESIIYGRLAVVAALGPAKADDPNRYVIAIELEGTAATGPNAAQRKTLRELVADIRRRLARALACLGHRDFQSVKACPGRLIPWVDYGGHGVRISTVSTVKPVATPEDPMNSFSVPEQRTTVTLKEDPARPGNSAWIYTTSACVNDGREISLAPNRPLVLVGSYSAAVKIVAYEPRATDADPTWSKTYFIRATDIARTTVVAVPVADCTAAIAAAVAPINVRLAACVGGGVAVAARIAAIKAKTAAYAADIAND